MNNKNKKDNAKKILTLLINLIISVSVYKLILILGDKVSVMFYYCGVTAFVSVIAILFCVFYAKNGYTFSNVKITEADLPLDMSSEEKAMFLEKQAKNKEIAQKLILIILPMILTVLINYIELIVSEILSV